MQKILEANLERVRRGVVAYTFAFVPSSKVTGLGSAIFAFMAAGLSSKLYFELGRSPT